MYSRGRRSIHGADERDKTCRYQTRKQDDKTRPRIMPPQQTEQAEGEKRDGAAFKDRVDHACSAVAGECLQDLPRHHACLSLASNLRRRSISSSLMVWSSRIFISNCS